MEKSKKWMIWFDRPAPMGNENVSTPNFKNLADDGWEKWSLPLGNGYMGVNVFGRTDVERLQVTENSLANPMLPGCSGGLNNFAEVYLDFGHRRVSEYRRDLDLEDAVAHVEYTCGGVRYAREYLACYPYRVFAVRLTASETGKLSFCLRPTIPYVKPYGQKKGDGCGKEGQVSVCGNTVTLSGRMEYYQVLFEGQCAVSTDGTVKEIPGEAALRIENATSAVVLIAIGTNYHLDSRVFTEKDPQKKLVSFPHPHEMVSGLMSRALKAGFEEIMAAHIQDYQRLFSRVSVDFGGTAADQPTDRLLEEYRQGKINHYLEELYFQYGRYLLISCSRKGALPANLQGVWNRYDSAPWSCGYWHNINVQMNYWPVFCCNLAETFEPYADYFRAYLQSAEQHATDYILRYFPDKSSPDGHNGWTIGTGAWPYCVNGLSTEDHSGPGTGALTSILFWEYYDFTRDRRILQEITFPALSGMSLFLSKIVRPYGDALLIQYSASPEQMSGERYYRTEGCAFDQQLMFENFKDTIQAAEALGVHNDLIRTLKMQMGHLEPVLIGMSGEVKEFREEKAYGDIGEYHHRHVSQLMGLYPGSCITCETPHWMEAAKKTLDLRGDLSTGWAMAHRLNLWARAHEGNRAYKLLHTLLGEGTLPNLLDSHPPFQIDGNFGGIAGIAEMLLQSHEGFIELLPALPEQWKTGSFRGLVARGNFEVSASWHDRQLRSVEILSKAGGACRIKLPQTGKWKTYSDKKRRAVPVRLLSDGIFAFSLKPGEKQFVFES